MNHQVFNHDAASLDVLEVGGLRIAVNRLGAELVSLQARASDGAWRGFLHRDGDCLPPPSGWGNHATVMGYYVHRLLGEVSQYRGRPVRGGTHGFLRHTVFGPPQLGANSVSYSLDPSRIPDGAYPLQVGFRIIYTLEGGSLKVTFAFDNREPEETAFLSFGLHPGFAVDGLDEFHFLMPPGNYIRHFAPGNFLDGTTAKITHSGGEMPFDRCALPDSYLLGLSEVPEPVFTLRTGDRQVVLDFRGVPFLTLWSSGEPFLCVEPCWGLPDSNPQTAFEDKAGIQTVAPGGNLEAAFTITPSLLPKS